MVLVSIPFRGLNVAGDGTQSALNGYIRDAGYLNGTNPTVGYAVVFNHVSNADAVYDYSLLFNSSNQDVPSTKYHSPVQDYRQGINYDFTSEYARHGFCTLQILIDDFAVKSQDSSFEGIKRVESFPLPYAACKEMISTLLQRQSFLSYLCFAFCIPSAVFSPCWYWKKNPDCGK